jgi:glycosyltransferase involved in cell wall biosynthesis
MKFARERETDKPAGGRVLFIRVGVFMSKQDINMGRYEILSREYSGEILEKVLRRDLKDFVIARFHFVGFRITGLARSSRVISNLLFGGFVLLRTVIRHLLYGRYDFIVTYDPFSAGLLGLILSKLLSCKLICEVNGNYGERKTWVNGGSRFLGSLKYHYCRCVIPFVINRAYATKLLYSGQLQPFGRRIKAHNIHVFHAYTPVLTQHLTSTQGNYLLFLGSPWELKGVDVLIKAYLRISDRFPRFRLRIVGWFPEPGLSYLKQLVGENKAVEIEKAVHYEEAMSLVANSYAVVLPSRSEAMGRVLLEAMAYGKPVIGSRVDGIPSYVKDGVNGLLFESENNVDLAEKIEVIFANKDIADRLGTGGYDHVRAHLSEEKYFEYFRDMLKGCPGRVWI